MTNEQERVISWLNDRARVVNSINDLHDLGIQQPLSIRQFGIQIFGIYAIYKLVGYELGLDLLFVDRKDTDYPWDLQFDYKGVIFHEVLSQKEKEEIENAITSN